MCEHMSRVNLCQLNSKHLNASIKYQHTIGVNDNKEKLIPKYMYMNIV